MSSAAPPADRSGPAERGRCADEGVRRGPTARPQLLTRRCTTCVFRPGNPMDLPAGQLNDIVEHNRAIGALLRCHQTLSYGAHPETGQAACRGFYDAYGPELLAVRIAELAMGGFDEIDPPETGAAHAR